MSLKSSIGLDWFDLTIHVGITGMFMIVAGSATTGRGSEVLVSMVVAISLGVLALRRAVAMKRAGSQGSGEYRAERIADLEHRVAQLEVEQGRVLELEERLDFAERLLARVHEKDQARLPGGSGR
jgi:hypothetical protein